MKKILLLLICFVPFLTSCDQKPAFDPSLLIGKWRSTEYDREDGLEMKIVFVMNFENEKDLSVEGKFYMEGIYLGKVKALGNYKIKGDKIKASLSDSDIEIDLQRGLFSSTKEYNEAEKELRRDIKRAGGFSGYSKVKKITDEELVLLEDDETTTFKRIKK